MAFALSATYVNFGNGSSTGWWAVTPWSAGATIAAGALRRQTSPAANSERVFVCIVAGTTGGSEPTWTTTVGAKTTDNTVTWQECTGQPAMNGDATNARAWSASRAFALGETIVDSNNKVQICTTAGTSKTAPAPTWSTTTGGTTTDNTVTWTCLGNVSGFSVTGFAAPHARMANAQVASWYPSVAPSWVFTSQNHAETQASSLTLTYGGTAALPTRVICVNDTTIPPTAASITTGASITTTGNSNLTFAGSFDSDGINYSAGTGANATQLQFLAAAKQIFRNCTLAKFGTTASGVAFTFNGANHSILEWYNVNIQFGSTGDGWLIDSRLKWRGGAITGGTYPTTLCNLANASAAHDVLIIGVDLSAITGTFFSIAANIGIGNITLESCILASSFTLTSGTPSQQGSLDIRLVNCSNGNTYVDYQKANYSVVGGTCLTEKTIIKTGGSSDGTNGFSRKVTTGANTTVSTPFELDPIIVWINSTGSPITPLIATLTDGVTLTNADIWCEVEYLGSSTTTLVSTAQDRIATLLTTPANQPTDSLSTWTTTGLSSPVKQTVGAAFTPQRIGYAKLTVHIAKPSTTIYIDQKVDGLGFVSGRQYQNGFALVNEGPSGSGGGPLVGPSALVSKGSVA